jgi:Holliday junction resolvase RusA-like endonuclease
MEALVFSMSGEPRGKGRPRTSVRGGFARVYTDAATRKYEASVRKIATAVMDGDPPLEGALSLSIRLRFPIRKTGSKATKAAKALGEIAPTVKPDWDNAAKAICDALNGVIYLDDSQIVRAFVTKVYSDKPGVDVRVEAYEPQGGEA